MKERKVDDGEQSFLHSQSRLWLQKALEMVLRNCVVRSMFCIIHR